MQEYRVLPVPTIIRSMILSRYLKSTLGVFYGMKAQLPLMLAQGHGVIINTASIAGLKGLPNAVAYSASKHAVVGMTKTAAMGMEKEYSYQRTLSCFYGNTAF